MARIRPREVWELISSVIDNTNPEVPVLRSTATIQGNVTINTPPEVEITNDSGDPIPVKNLDVLLSTRATEATLATIASEVTVASILTELQQKTEPTDIQVVEPSKITTLTNSAVQASNVSATQLFAANANRKSFIIVNNGPNTIYVGASSVTVDSGIPVKSNASFSTDSPLIFTGALFAIAETAAQVSPADTRVLEVFA